MNDKATPSEAPTPPDRPQHAELTLTLQSVRAEVAHGLNRLKDDVMRQIVNLERQLDSLQDKINSRDKHGMSLEAMVGRVTDALTVQGASIERTEELAVAILGMLRTQEKAAAVLEAMRQNS